MLILSISLIRDILVILYDVIFLIHDSMNIIQSIYNIKNILLNDISYDILIMFKIIQSIDWIKYNRYIKKSNYHITIKGIIFFEI